MSMIFRSRVVAGQRRRCWGAAPGLSTIWILWLCLLAPAGRAGSSALGDNKEVEALLTRGRSYLERELYSQAAAEFQKAAALNPRLARAFYYLGLTYWKMRTVERAAGAFSKALSLEPDDDYSRYYLGRIHLVRGQTREAIDLFEDLTRKKSLPVADEHYQLGLAYLKSGAANKASQSLKKAAELNPRDAGTRDALAKAYQAAGRAEEAEREFRLSRQLRQQALESSQMLQRCRQHLESGEIDKALEMKRRLLESGGPSELIALGIMLGESGLREHAVEPLKKAVALEPENFEAQYNLGFTYLGLGNDERAEEHLNRAANIRDDSFEAYSLLGLALSNLKQNLPAIKSLSKAAELRPDNPKVLSLLALQYIEGRFYEEAIRVLLRASLGSSDPSLNFLLIQAYYKNHDFEKSLQVARETLQRFPRMARAHFELGFQLANMGRFRESKPYFEKVLEMEPQHAEACYWLADLLLKDGKAQESLSYFRKALQTNDSYIEAHAGLAKALLHLKRYHEAVSEIEKGIAVDPDEPQLHLHLSHAYRGLGQTEDAEREAQIFERLNKQRMKKRDLEGERKLAQP